MFLYDWSKIYSAGDSKTREIVRIFKMLVNKQVPKNRYDPIYKYSQKNFSGVSFMLNPEALLHHSYKYTHREITEYIFLCSLRAVADYYSTKSLSLDVLLIPVTNSTKMINNNRLLSIEKGFLHFLYEKSSYGEK